MRGRPPGIRPDIAFIVDIRRENRALHLLYKALFELSVDRGDFVSRLFSRRRPPAASANTGVKELFDAYETVSADRGVFTENLSLIRSRLLEMHRIALTPEDLASIESLYDAFHSRGPTINYRQGDLVGPAFSTLMANEDIFGGERSFLAGEESFRYVKNLHERNLIVPLVGDFAGPHTLRRVGEFLREHDEHVRVFYGSNVEVYLSRAQAAAFCANLAGLPQDARSWFIGNKGMRPLRTKVADCAEAGR